MDTNYDGLAITLAQPFTFSLKPAIELYPVVSVGSTDYAAGRTDPGATATIVIPAGGDTNNYIHGVDWLESLGDLSDMVLTDRALDTDISFSVKGDRLKNLVIGKASGTVQFNATSLFVESPTITSIDARNTTRLGNIINLFACPRLRTCLFSGSGATGLLLPVGAKLTTVSFPTLAQTVFMHSLPALTNANLTLPSLAGIQNLYINNCQNIDPFDIAEDIVETQGNTLAYATLSWSGTPTTKSSTLVALAGLSGRVDYENGNITTVNGKANVEGTVNVFPMYANDYDQLDIVSEETYQGSIKKALSRAFNTNLYLLYDYTRLYIKFADPDVETAMVALCGDGTGVTPAMAATVTNMSQLAKTAYNTFDELVYFTGVSTISFMSCTNLTSVTLPAKNISNPDFRSCSSLVHIGNMNRIVSMSSGSIGFSGCSSLAIDVNLPNLTACSTGIFRNSGVLSVSSLGSITTIGGASNNQDGVFENCLSLTSVILPNTLTMIGCKTFYGCKSLSSVFIPQGVTIIYGSAFYGCTALTSIDLPSSITNMSDSTFKNCTSLNTFIIRATTPPTINSNAFSNCPATMSILVPAESVSAYKSASNWSARANYIFAIQE